MASFANIWNSLCVQFSTLSPCTLRSFSIMSTSRKPLLAHRKAPSPIPEKNFNQFSDAPFLLSHLMYYWLQNNPCHMPSPPIWVPCPSNVVNVFCSWVLWSHYKSYSLFQNTDFLITLCNSTAQQQWLTYLLIKEFYREKKQPCQILWILIMFRNPKFGKVKQVAQITLINTWAYM